MEQPHSELEQPRGFGGTPDPEPPTDEEGNELPTEEEQQDYDLLTVRGRKLVFGKGKEKILRMLGSSENPAQGLGKAASMIMKSLVDSARQAGREIDTGVVIHAGMEVIQDLNDLAKANGVYQYDSEKDEDQQVTDALMWGAKYYGDGQLAAGEITPEFQQLAKAQVDQQLAEEGTPKQSQVAQGVGQAVGNQLPGQMPGLIGSQMGGM